MCEYVEKKLCSMHNTSTTTTTAAAAATMIQQLQENTQEYRAAECQVWQIVENWASIWFYSFKSFRTTQSNKT